MDALARIDAWPAEASAVGVTDAETTLATRGSTGGLPVASGLPPDEDGRRAPVASRRIYSNLGFETLGALVEERANVRLAHHLRRPVLAPLGMRETELVGSPAHGAMSTCGDLLALGRELLAPSLLDPGLACAFVGDREFGPWAARSWPDLSDAVLAGAAG